MSNNPSRPLVAPSEYERNRAAITNYRAYLDMYEKMNEQGMRNHEELERLEQLLHQRIRAGEEAKQQLDVLRQSSTRLRLTDGQVVVPDLTSMAPSVPPVVFPAVQTPSSSAYIEEVPYQEQKTTSNTSYSPYTTSTHLPQPSYVNQQRRPASNIPPYAAPQYNQQVERNVPTPPQHVQAASNRGQQPQPSTVSRSSHQPQVQSQPSTRAAQMANSTSTRSEQYRFLQQQQDHPRQAMAAQSNVQPNVPNATSNPYHHQYVQYYRNAPVPVPTPYQQVQRNHAQLQVNSQHQQSRIPSVTGPGGPQVTEGQSAPRSASTAPGPIPTVVADTARFTSSLDGALGQVPKKNVQSSDSVAASHFGSTTAQPSVPIGAPPTAGTTGGTSMDGTQSPVQRKASFPTPLNGVLQSSSPAVALQSLPTGSPDTRTSNPVPSPIRTPGQANKSHLARDLLRALKRPRQSSSSVQEPAPKRHAPELPAKLVAQPIQHPPGVASLNAQAPTSMPRVSQQIPQVPLPDTPPVPATATTTSSASTQPAIQASSSIVIQPIATHQLITPSTNLMPYVPAQPTNPPSQLGGSAFSTLVPAQTSEGTSNLQSTNKPHHADMAARVRFGQFGLNHVMPKAPDQLSREKQIEEHIVVAGTSQSPQDVEAPAVLISGPSAVELDKDQGSTPVIGISAPLLPAVSGSTSASNVVISAGTSDSDRVPVEVLEAPVADKMRIAHLLTGKDPLFLPSPSSPTLQSFKPAMEVPLVLSLTKKKDKGKGKAIDTASPTLKSQKAGVPSGSNMVFAYVLVPQLPEYAKRWKARQRSLGLEGELDIANRDPGDLVLLSRSRSPSLGDYNGPSTSRSTSASAASVEVIDLADNNESDMEESGSWGVHFSNYDEAEQQVLHEHCSVLRECFCRWMGCEVTLNTPGALLRHLDFEHGPRRINAESPWTCRWAGCGYTVILTNDYRQHIEKHAVFPLWCPFKGCAENFRTPRQLIKHKRNNHASNAVLRPTAQPSTRDDRLIALMPKIPKILPSYMTVYRLVRPAPITRQRHEIIMPSVLRRISGNVPAQLQRYNAARPMPTTPSGKSAEPPLNTPYSFLEHRSTRYSSYLSTPARSKNIKSLSSGYVTNLTKRGLVLWPDKESSEALPRAMMEELEQLEEVAVEKELLDEEGYDVFGPTIPIETPNLGSGDGSGTGGAVSDKEAPLAGIDRGGAGELAWPTT